MKGTEFTSGALKVLSRELTGIKNAILVAGSGSGEGGGVSENVLVRLENLEAVVAGINLKVSKILGENDTTAEIDTLPEMIAFLAGRTNDQRIDNVVSGTVDEDGIIHY